MVELVKVEHQAIKKKWQRRFARDQDRNIKEWGARLSRQDLGGQDVRCYVATENRRELGFIRMHDKSKFFAGCADTEVWNLTEVFVKPASRHNGILRAMIAQAVRDLNVKMISLSPDCLDRYQDYYVSLGFSCFYPLHHGATTWAFLSEFADVVKRHIEETA